MNTVLTGWRVWNMRTEQYVQAARWMQYCPYILFPKELYVQSDIF
jgi:hypothetical protein